MKQGFEPPPPLPRGAAQGAAHDDEGSCEGEEPERAHLGSEGIHESRSAAENGRTVARLQLIDEKSHGPNFYS